MWYTELFDSADVHRVVGIGLAMMKGARMAKRKKIKTQPNPFSIAGFWPQMQAYDVRDDALSRWQVFEQVAHLEEEHHKDGEPKFEVGNYR